ncbi:MAG: hypothetical protein L0H53_04020 [Candidatus Nitrosocosmicus sp.]|nr:hypothetical protein [Candidatus Nitrosocosmicus sp.]
MDKRNGSTRNSRFSSFSKNKRNTFIVISVIVVIVIVVWVTSSNTMNSTSSIMNINTNGNTGRSVDSNIVQSSSVDTIVNESQLMKQKDKQLFCGNQTQGPSFFVNEYVLPISCSQPLGLAIDKNNNIWIASGKTGNLFVFDPKSNSFNKTIPIPNWPIDRQGQIGSMIWDLKFDNNGDLWFTDQRSNSIWKYFVDEKRFENYRILQDGGYPLSIAFDSTGKLWFTQVFGKRLGLLDPALVQDNTTKGISELDFLNQIQFVTMGPISNGYGYVKNDSNQNTKMINNQSEVLWFSTVSYPVGGQLVKYDIGEETSSIHDLTHLNAVPISISEDENGNVWVNDHDSSKFIMLNPNTGAIKQFATSNSSTASKSTLPYYNEYRNGKLWFNEHYGNAIAYYDKENQTLVEFIVPSVNPLWGNGSNPLRFAIDDHGSVWFTEWTENKLGVISKEKIEQIPISVYTSKDKIRIDSSNNIGDSVEVYVSKSNSQALDGSSSSSDGLSNYTTTQNSNSEFNDSANITMFVTSSKSDTGELSNLTSKFSTKNFTIESTNPRSEINATEVIRTYNTTLDINPAEGLEPGNHTLTISARYNNDLTVSKIIDMEIL